VDIALANHEVVPQLWNAYKKTPEFRQGRTQAIPAHHPLVERQERVGLLSIYTKFVEELRANQNAKEALSNRSVGDWLSEWRGMHKMLFRHILLDCGNWRHVDVRFGSPGDEELHRIPIHQLVPRDISALAYGIREFLGTSYQDEGGKYSALAKVHYQFIRIHPFFDGNGRIARAITDQMAIYFGFPAAMAGYPRHEEDRRIALHRAVRSCADDPDCEQLASWIKGYIENRLQTLA